MKRIRTLFIEFLVIVLGVLVALLMESAWQEHQDDQLADEYLERLREDLIFNRDVLESDFEFSRINCDASTLAGQALTGDVDLPAEQVVLYTWAAALNYTPTYNTATWDDLLASGRIGLIESANLREQIIDLYQLDVFGWRPTREDPIREMVFRTLPGKWLADTARECLTLTGFKDGWEACALERLEGAEALANRLRQKPELIEELNTRNYYACSFPRWLNQYETLLTELEESLDE